MATDLAPRVWLLMSRKAGDNAQVLALGEALGWPFEIKSFVYRQKRLIPYSLLDSTLSGIVASESSPLTPPWPELIISIGRRNDPVCRWIRQQAGGGVRLVRLGRPRNRLESFDLIVTTPQYRLPRLANVLHNETPLHRVTKNRLAEAQLLWHTRLSHLPRPWIAVLTGGDSGPYAFTLETAQSLCHEAAAMSEKAGGSLLVTTSARTPQFVTDTWVKTIATKKAHFFRWTPKAADNPYYGYLALADVFIVTGDSVSMLTEACATGKPVFIFPLKENRTIRARLYRLRMCVAPPRLTRDLRQIHNALVASGRATWLGETFPPKPPRPSQDMQRTLAAVRALFEPTPSVQAARDEVRSSTSKAS